MNTIVRLLLWSVLIAYFTKELNMRREILAWAGVIATAILLVLFTAKMAGAQEHHAQGHNDYQYWASGVTTNCCNNDDCGDLEDDRVRETSTGTEVKIEDQWCPVEIKHYITQGESPNWNKAHACISPSRYAAGPCQKLLCFAGKGGF